MTNTQVIRVLIADDEPDLRRALTDLVAVEDDLELAGTAASADEAAAVARSTQPNVAVVDVRMPGGGAEATRLIRQSSPETAVLALSAYEDRATVISMLRAGAVGYLVKGVPSDEIVEAIRRAGRGQASLSAAMTAEVLEELARDATVRREAEEVLRKSEERFRGLLDSAPDAVVIVRDDGAIVLVNRRTEELFGYGREELLGERIEMLLPERFREHHVDHRAGYLASPTTRPMGLGLELAGLRKDGTEFPVDISLSTIETHEGRLVTAFVRDIAARKEIEELGREAMGRFAALLDSAPDAIVIANRNGTIELVNAQTEKLFGYDREELLGGKIEKLIPKRFRERHVDHRDGYFHDPRTRPMGAELELAGRRKDGTEFPVDISLSALQTEEGTLATAFVRDITDRVRADSARRKTEERFADLLEAAPDAVVVVDGSGSIVFVNRQTEALFEYNRSELLGERVELLIPERFRENHVNERGGYMEHPQTRPMGNNLELSGRRKDGSEFPVEISLSALETDEGRRVTAFVRDVTERVATADLQRHLAERRRLVARVVRASEEERARIASDIHDDTVQAMTAVGLRLGLLRRRLGDEAHLGTLDQLEETVRNSIARLRTLIFELRPPELDREGLVPAIRSRLEQLKADEGLDFRIEDRLIREPEAETKTIAYRIVQEALANTRKHAQASLVEIFFELRGIGLFGSVRDDGRGFSPEELAAQRKLGHLGVVAMRERAEVAGGWLRIESAPGEGTRVEFWIPDAPLAASGNEGADESMEAA